MGTSKQLHPKANLDLDVFERPDAPEPFVLTLGGREYTLRDPVEVDYRELLSAHRAWAAGDPETAIEASVSEEDRAEFFANPLPSYKLQAMFEAYNDHYGIEVEKAVASPLS